jgi:hypothetical protein
VTSAAGCPASASLADGSWSIVTALPAYRLADDDGARAHAEQLCAAYVTGKPMCVVLIDFPKGDPRAFRFPADLDEAIQGLEIYLHKEHSELLRSLKTNRARCRRASTMHLSRRTYRSSSRPTAHLRTSSHAQRAQSSARPSSVGTSRSRCVARLRVWAVLSQRERSAHVARQGATARKARPRTRLRPGCLDRE